MFDLTSQDLHPMKVTPASFTRGDVVKKIYADNITTPYTGVVTAIIPQTNKVEVQWPHGLGMEDPWDLIRVNPILHPPTVKEDKTYQTYQNQQAQKYNEDYCKDLKHYKILDEYLSEKLMPIINKASSLFNKGYTKKEAFSKLSKNVDHRQSLFYALNKVFSEKIAVEKYDLINIDGESKEASLIFKGDHDNGFSVTLKEGSNSETFNFDRYRDALSMFSKLSSLLSSQDYLDNEAIVKKVGSVRNHVKTAKDSSQDISDVIDMNMKGD